MMFVTRMIARELRSSWRRLLFFFICIAIGVGAIVALRSVIQSVRQTFAGEARSLITADAIITSNQVMKPELSATIDERLAAAGATSMRSVEIATMVRAANVAEARSRMVELRAVEPGFPYYGRMTLAGGQPYSYDLLKGGGVLVRPELQAQLGVTVGDTLTIGEGRFEIRGVIDSEPGRRLGAFSLGPRVFVALEDFEKTGLLTFGSRASHQRLVQGAGCDARRAGHVATQRLLEPVRAGPLLQGHGRRHRRELRARRGLSEPRGTGDCHPGRHRRLQRDAGLRPAEDPHNRGVEVRGRAVVAAARDLPGTGGRARPRGERAGRAARGRRHRGDSGDAGCRGHPRSDGPLRRDGAGGSAGAGNRAARVPVVRIGAAARRAPREAVAAVARRAHVGAGSMPCRFLRLVSWPPRWCC